VTDSIIYEARPIPPRDPKDGRRQKWSAILGAAAVITVLLVGVAFGAALFRGSDEPDPLAEADPTKPTVTVQTTTTVANSPLASRDQRSRGIFGAGDSESFTRPARPGGDVGTPTPALPAQEFNWDRVTLDLPEGEEAYLQGVYAVDGGFLALAISYDAQGQSMVVWESADGLSWEPTALDGDFSNANVWNVVFNEYGAIAFGEEFVDYEGGEEVFHGYAPVRLIWTSADGVTWNRAELDLTTADNQEVWINTGIAGPDGFIVVGQRSTSPEFEPMLLEKDGFTLELSDYTSTYRVLDGSGAMVAEGSMQDIYRDNYTEDGQAIINPDTGELLTVLPHETWEMAWEQAYSEPADGPFGGFGGTPPVISIEFDGYRITLDEETSTYQIEDVASGELIYSGSADHLWRGPAPVFTDASGTEILRFTWEEFDAAQQAYWEDNEWNEPAYQSDVVIARSADGVTWTESVVDTEAREVSFDSVLVRDGGYIAYGNQYDEYSGGPAIWTSPDGVTWEQVADMPGGMYIWNVKEAADGTLLALGDGPQGQALWSSTDGIAWGEAFGTRIPEDRTLYEYLNQFGTGELGTFIVGSRERNFYDEQYFTDNPLRFTQGEYTLTFNDYDWPPRVTVVDDTTGDVVIDTTLLEEGGLPEDFYYEDGVTYIENNDIVLMAITDDEWYRARDEHWMGLEESYDYEPGQTTVYFSADLNDWTEVPFDFAGWLGHVAVGADSVVLAGEEYSDEPRLLEAEGAYDEDFEYTPPDPVILVGRP
jgi:hypothetical protein